MKYLPQDKGTHYFYNQWVAILSYVLLVMLNKPHAIEIAICFSIAVGISVELYQKKTKTGVCDWKDLAWGTGGTIAAFVPLLAALFLV